MYRCTSCSQNHLLIALPPLMFSIFILFSLTPHTSLPLHILAPSRGTRINAFVFEIVPSRLFDTLTLISEHTSYREPVSDQLALRLTYFVGTNLRI